MSNCFGGILKERTFELTNFCPHSCGYCSSDTTMIMEKAKFLDFDLIKKELELNGHFDCIILSGGEPLSHPRFYDILKMCENYTKDVVIYSNAIKHLVYNANVIDGVYVEANLNVLTNVEKLHILKRVEQGRENKRPEIKFSSNWNNDNSCVDSCTHEVIRPDGSRGRPCMKVIK